MCIEVKAATGFSDGSAALYSIGEDDEIEVLSEWKETRFKQRYVGLGLLGSSKYVPLNTRIEEYLNTSRSVLSCTANGALRRTRAAEGQVEADIAALPARLCDWKLASNGDAFTYGGDEVEVSLWDTEKAFAAPPVVVSEPAPPAGKKRKRNDVLLPGEIWRAKNVSLNSLSRRHLLTHYQVANDNLGLRQPVHNTSLAFISSTSTSAHDIAAGTQYGHVRRYDTRAARKPVADWDKIATIGGVRAVQKGLNEQ